MKRTVAILGVTGRLGPAIVRAFAPEWETRGLSRRAPADGETAPGTLIRADRHDAGAVRRCLEDADVIVDLLAFAEDDAHTVLEAIDALQRAPGHLVLASSIAALDPDDRPYGEGKRRVQRLYESRFPGRVSTLVLPRLVAPVDHGRREQPYLDAAAGGRVLVAGSGDQRQTIAPVDGVASIVRSLAEGRGEAGALFVGPPEPLRVRDAVAALLEGAGLDVPLARHPEPGWRGPHSGGDEVLDTQALHAHLPDLRWPDPLETHRELGRWLSRHRAESRAPRPLVSLAKRRPAERRVVDVHDRRPDPPVPAPIDALAEVAAWLTPAFYVDVGRPCNSLCVYCAVPPHADTAGFTPLSGLRDEIRAGVRAGCRRAILVGGEPTIYPELDALLDALQAAGLRDGNVVMTNGLRLAREEHVEQLVRGGVRTFHVSIDTADPALADRLGRTRGTHARQRAALDHLLRREDARCYVYCCVTALNSTGVRSLLELVAERASAAGRTAPPVLLAFVKPIGDALVHGDQLLLAPIDRACVARDAVAAGEALGVAVGLRNLQDCLAPELASHNVDHYLHDYSIEIESGTREAYAHTRYSVFPERCGECARRSACCGVYQEDARRYAAAAWRPIE